MLSFLDIRFFFFFIIISLHISFLSEAMEFEEATDEDYLRARITLQRKIVRELAPCSRGVAKDLYEAETEELRVLETALTKYQSQIREQGSKVENIDRFSVGSKDAPAFDRVQKVIEERERQLKRLQRSSDHLDICEAEQKSLTSLKRHSTEPDMIDMLARVYDGNAMPSSSSRCPKAAEAIEGGRKLQFFKMIQKAYQCCCRRKSKSD